MSIDLSAFPRRDGVVEGRWALLFRSPIDHEAFGAVVRRGITVEPIEGMAVQRLVCAFGPDVFLAVRVDDLSEAVSVPTIAEVGDELIRLLQERQVDVEDLPFPWGEMLAMYDAHERLKASLLLERAKEALRDIAAERDANPELADADATTVTTSLPRYTAELDKYYRAHVAELEAAEAALAHASREAAEKAAKDVSAAGAVSGGAETGDVVPVPVAETLPAPADAAPTIDPDGDQTATSIDSPPAPGITPIPADSPAATAPAGDVRVEPKKGRGRRS